mgnify:CR=1 FL=1
MNNVKTYRKVGAELSADNAVGAVSTHHLAPDNSELRTRHGLLGLVDVSNFLAKVEVGSGLVVNTLHGEKGSVVVGVGETSVITLLKKAG